MNDQACHIVLGVFFSLGAVLSCAEETTPWEDRLQQANVLQRDGRYSEAEGRYKVLVDEAERFASADPRRARVLNNLAALYFRQGKYLAAEPLYRRAMEQSEKIS